MLKSLYQKFGALASTSLLLMVSMTIVNAGNYVYNLIMGRWLGPELFADISLIVTLLLVVTFITVPLQMVAARYAALAAAGHEAAPLASVRRWLSRLALLSGGLLAAGFVLPARQWSSFFNTASPTPFILFGLALPFSLLQGVNRGVLQGQTRFVALALTYQTEMWSRLLLGMLLVWAGLSVNGAVLGISLSFVATWLATLPAGRGLGAGAALDPDVRRAALLFALPVLISQASQILINNSDILLVRRFYPAEAAGQYAALALIGRIVFFATWSVVTTMFPLVTQRHKRGEPYRHLLWVSLGMVGGISLPVVLATLAFPQEIVRVLFGAKYTGVAPLLWLYALATTLYALANVVVNYRLSLGQGRETGLTLAAGVAQVVGIAAFHDTLAQVVWVQVVVMGALFLALSLVLALRPGKPASMAT
ncbi:MAG: oligosaccharide flippase family protein [Chloroflexota bacterium]